MCCSSVKYVDITSESVIAHIHSAVNFDQQSYYNEYVVGFYPHGAVVGWLVNGVTVVRKLTARHTVVSHFNCKISKQLVTAVN
jgi:hypothetical protein